MRVDGINVSSSVSFGFFPAACERVLFRRAGRKGLDRRTGLRPTDITHNHRPSRASGAEQGIADMKHIISLALAAATPLGVSAASAETSGGSTGLALAAVVAIASPLLTSAERKAVDELFAENSNISYKKKIVVTADKIVCRTSNVDITLRSCELAFGKTTKTINGRAANELYATQAMAGVPADAAAGTNYESIARLSCTLDPQAIKQKDGSGASCTYEMVK
jgi:hypothetical protein